MVRPVLARGSAYCGSGVSKRLGSASKNLQTRIQGGAKR